MLGRGRQGRGGRVVSCMVSAAGGEPGVSGADKTLVSVPGPTGITAMLSL